MYGKNKEGKIGKTKMENLFSDLKVTFQMNCKSTIFTLLHWLPDAYIIGIIRLLVFHYKSPLLKVTF